MRPAPRAVKRARWIQVNDANALTLAAIQGALEKVRRDLHHRERRGTGRAAQEEAAAMKAVKLKRRRRVIRDEGPDPIDIFVGRRLRERRRQENLSQTALSGRLGVSFQAVQKYEAAKTRISASTLYRLCQLLGVGPAYFFEGYVGPAEAALKRKQRKR
jgi:ribosome-binding protein aMBF1 (putative translation factor)